MIDMLENLNDDMNLEIVEVDVESYNIPSVVVGTNCGDCF